MSVFPNPVSAVGRNLEVGVVENSKTSVPFPNQGYIEYVGPVTPTNYKKKVDTALMLHRQICSILWTRFMVRRSTSSHSTQDRSLALVAPYDELAPTSV